VKFEGKVFLGDYDSEISAKTLIDTALESLGDALFAEWLRNPENTFVSVEAVYGPPRYTTPVQFNREAS
jgi:hypothetical protein